MKDKDYLLLSRTKLSILRNKLQCTSKCQGLNSLSEQKYRSAKIKLIFNRDHIDKNHVNVMEGGNNSVNS